MNWINKQLADVERGCGKQICPSCQEIEPDEEENGHKFDCEYEGEGLNECGKNKFLCSVCQAKRQTLLMCQAEREKENQEITDKIKWANTRIMRKVGEVIKDKYDFILGIVEDEEKRLLKEITALLEGDGK